MFDDAPYSHPLISLIIPVYRDDAALERLLRQIKTVDIFEVIIVDGEGRRAPPHGLSGVETAAWLRAPRGRGPQIAAGLKAARGTYLWVLHADTQINMGSADEIHRILSQPRVALGMFRLGFGKPGRAYTLFELFARLDTPLSSFGDQGFFFRREDWQALSPRLERALKAAPILEDVIMRKAFKTRGRVKKSNLHIMTSPRRFERVGLWTAQIRNAVILFKARLGATPQSLYEAYYHAPQNRVVSSRLADPAVSSAL